ncbi:MAG: DUF3098 domain-containing protein [Fidelibacterota bacterium]
MKEKTKEQKPFIEKLTLGKTNYLLFALGLFLIILGYFIMGTGEVNSTQSLSIAPVVLLIGYLVVIPASILYKSKK